MYWVFGWLEIQRRLTMSWSEATVIGRVSTALNDPSTAIWGTATIQAQIALDLRIINDVRPQLTYATVAFAGTARELSISGISDVLDIEEVEFPISKQPRRFVNFTRRGNLLTLDDYRTSVSTADTAYIWYAAPHTVSGTVNTLDPSEEAILVELVASHLLQNLAIDKIDSVPIYGTPWREYLTSGERREQKVMTRLYGLAKSNFAVRYPDVK